MASLSDGSSLVHVTLTPMRVGVPLLLADLVVDVDVDVEVDLFADVVVDRWAVR